MFTKVREKILFKLVILLPFVLFLVFRLDGIVADMTNSDGIRWHHRSENFMTAVKSFNFGQTYQSYHPGVTLMWLTAFTEWGIKFYDKYTGQEFKTLQNTDGYLVIDGASKIVLIVALFILLVVQYNYIQLLFDRGVAFLFVLIASIEPYFIGINRWYHLTSLEVFLTFCSFLALLLWAEFKFKHYLYKSAIFLGLAAITKFSSLLVLPVFLIIIVNTIRNDKEYSGMRLQTFLKYFSIFSGVSMLTAFALFPALWTAPFNVIQHMYAAAINAGVGDYQPVVFAKDHPLLYYFVILIFKLSPVTLILFLIGFLKSRIWKDRLINYLFLYIFTVFIFLTLSDQKIERYILAIVPAIILICAIVLARVNRGLQLVALGVYLIFTLFMLQSYRPLYSAYYSPIFGGPNNAYKKNFYDDNGEYFARAAQYFHRCRVKRYD